MAIGTTWFIALEVTPRAKDVTTSADRSGTRFRIVAPRDLEPAGSDDKIAKPLRRHARD